MRGFERDHGVPIVQAWGMTETSPLATVAKPPTGLDEDQQWALRATQGRPICGVEIRLRNDQDRTLPCNGEAVGEIQARGPWVTGSYFRDDDADKFDQGGCALAMSATSTSMAS